MINVYIDGEYYDLTQEEYNEKFGDNINSLNQEQTIEKD